MSIVNYWVCVCCLFACTPFLASCMVKSHVALMVIRNIGSGLVAPRAVPAGEDGFAKLGPRTQIRGIASDGTLTPWYESGELWVYGAGMSQEPVRLGALEIAYVSGLDPEEEKWLEETKPQEGWARVTTGSSVTTLYTRRVDHLIPWIQRFLSRAQAAGKPLGSWELTGKAALGGIAKEEVRGGPLEIDPKALLDAGKDACQFGAAHALPWSSAEQGFELRYFELGKNALAVIPILPVALVVGIIYVAAGGNFNDSSNAEYTRGGGPTVLLSPDALTHAQPLFTPTAQRRGLITLIAAAEGAGSIQTDGRAGLSLSIRLVEILELGAFARGLTIANDANQANQGRQVHWVAGGRMGLHLPLENTSSWAIAAGADVGAAVSGRALRTGGFYAGLRRAWGRDGFVAIHPLVPTWTSDNAAIAPTRQFRWMFELEVGMGF